MLFLIYGLNDYFESNVQRVTKYRRVGVRSRIRYINTVTVDFNNFFSSHTENYETVSPVMHVHSMVCYQILL